METNLNTMMKNNDLMLETYRDQQKKLDDGYPAPFDPKKAMVAIKPKTFMKGNLGVVVNKRIDPSKLP